MEEQKIITTTKPRITLKKTTGKYNWDIASSESGSLAEIKLIISELETANEIMMGKFSGNPEHRPYKVKKEEVKKKK